MLSEAAYNPREHVTRRIAGPGRARSGSASRLFQFTLTLLALALIAGVPVSVASAAPPSSNQAPVKSVTTLAAAAPKSSRIASSLPVSSSKKQNKLRSEASNAVGILMLSLAVAGALLLLVAAIEPSRMRPRSLQTSFAEHRGDVAIAGILVLLGLAVVYVVARGPLA